VVTGDSMSMLTEVARLQRKLAIYPLRQRPRRQPAWLAAMQRHVKYRVLPQLGFTAYPRDLTQIHQALYAAGAAVVAGAPFRDGVLPGDELDRVVEAVVAVCNDGGERRADLSA
jgi:hypothetical protein